MRVLMLTQVLPYPLDSGPKFKSYYVLRNLATQHQLTLVSFIRQNNPEAIAHLSQYCQKVLTVEMRRGAWRDGLGLGRSVLAREPLLMARDSRRAMHNLVSSICDANQFEVVHADQLNMAQYAIRVPEAKRVLDAHNALWVVFKRLAENSASGPWKWILGREWRALKKYEGDMGKYFDKIVTVSDQDKESFITAGVAAEKLTVIPIVIDTDEIREVNRDPDADHILHIGTMFWPPNVEGIQWFLHEVWPLINQQNPGIVFDIVGSKPPKEITRFSLEEHSVNVTGYVDDPEPYLRSAAVMVVPLLSGGGMRVKILNALAQKIPIVSTPIGCEGIDVEDGKNIMIAESPIAFAHAVSHLLKNPAFGKVLADNGHDLIKKKYDYRRIQKDLEGLYDQIPSNDGKRHNE